MYLFWCALRPPLPHRLLPFAVRASLLAGCSAPVGLESGRPSLCSALAAGFGSRPAAPGLRPACWKTGNGLPIACAGSTRPTRRTASSIGVHPAKRRPVARHQTAAAIESSSSPRRNGGRDRIELIASTPRGRGGQAGSCVVEVRVAGSTRGAASSVTTNFTVAVARASPLRLRVISGLIRDYGRTVHDFRYKVKYFLHDVSVGRDRRGGRGENYRIFNALYASNGTSPKTAARAGPDRP